MGGVVLGIFILNHFSFFSSLEALFSLFFSLLTTPWILKTLAFALLVGSVMALIEKSGGIAGFVDFAQHRVKLVNSPRSALLLSYFIGVFIFIESSITALVAGAVGKPFAQKYKIPSEKLAFVCDSTSAPISSLIVLNGWGALLLGIISAQVVSHSLNVDPVALLIDSLFYNFYAMSALVVTFVAVYFDIELGAMKRVKFVPSLYSNLQKTQSKYYMILPIVSMIVFVFFYLYITGDGDMMQGSGSSSVFYTMVTTLVLMFIYYIPTKNMSAKQFVKSSFLGAKNLFSVVVILLLAFAIGKITSQLQTGVYLASLASSSLEPLFVAPLIFVLSAIIAFSTGTSWGTFSIMIPIAIPIALGVESDVALAIGAVISGGVFGDHVSPISDTTIISSIASDCEVISHVKTQMPYALVSASVTFILFIIFSAK
jgi:Na+/H+ antiporter NhaC